MASSPSINNKIGMIIMNTEEKEAFIKEHDIRLIQNKHGKYIMVYGILSLIGKPKPRPKLSSYVRVGTRRG